MNRKPRLLFLSFYSPPLHAVASVRTGNIAKHLSRIGWDVSVVAPDPSLWQSPDDMERVAAEMDRWGAHMIYTGHRWRCLSSGHLKRSYRHGIRWFLEGIPRLVARTMSVDEMVGWYPEAERACAKLRPGDVDVVLATGGPFGAFRVAQGLARRLRCPYVLDYRDLWTGNPHAHSRDRDGDQTAERRLLEGCTAVSVVSPSIAQYLSHRFGVTEKVHVIPNGYDPADLESIEPMAFGHLATVYAGGFFPPKSDAGPLMRTLRRLAELEPVRPWRFHYYGPSDVHVREAAKVHGVGQMVEVHGMVPRRECLAAIRGATAAVVVVSVYNTADIADRGIITGKVFEPIGLGTPVLVVAPPGSDVVAVIETVGGGAVFSGSNTEGMAAYLADVMRGSAPYSRHPEEYSWPRLIYKMDAMLRQAVPLQNLCHVLSAAIIVAICHVWIVM
jgi:glycosyltransferase involved in cell wall biosynthesis